MPYGFKIVDFGLSQFTNSDGRIAWGTRMGTSVYMSPEAVMYKRLSTKTDVWACGVILYRMFELSFPFGNVAENVFDSILKDELVFKGQNWENVSESTKDFIKYLLQKDHKPRPTATEALKHPWITKNRRMAPSLKKIKKYILLLY